MIYYIYKDKLNRLLRKSGYTLEDLPKLFPGYHPLVDVEPFFSKSGPTRDNFLVGYICDAFDCAPPAFTKYKREPFDEAYNISYEKLTEMRNSPLDYDESHYVDWSASWRNVIDFNDE